MSRRCAALVNYDVGSINQCTGEVEYQQYGYLINEGSAYFFVIVFGLSTLLHVYQAIRYRTWSMLWTASACALLETLGWGGRLGSAINTRWIPFLGGYYGSGNYDSGGDSFFIMQICCLIIAPAFLAGAIYIALGYTINHVGARFSPIKPKTYLYIFVACDVGSLVVQAIGGGVASSNQGSLAKANTGARIMLAGIIFQVVAMLSYFTVFGIFVSRLRKGIAAGEASIDQNAKWLLIGITASMFFIFVRSVYRIAELSEGWVSDLIQDQNAFIVLDAVMMLIAVWLINWFHPGRLLPRSSHNVRIKQADMSEKQANTV